MVKICSKCGIAKHIDEFKNELKTRTDGSTYIYVLPKCKECDKKYQQEYFNNNKDRILANAKIWQIENWEKVKGYKLKSRQNNPQRDSDYRAKNRDELNRKEKQRSQTQEGRKKKREYFRKRRQDPVIKLRDNVSTLILSHLKKNGGSKYGKSIFDYLEYTVDELWTHLENQFEPWMTRENRGKYDLATWNDNDPTTWTWQLDHIIPQSDLPYITMEEENFKKCWALENLRPLSAKQNLLDGTRKIRHKIR